MPSRREGGGGARQPRKRDDSEEPRKSVRQLDPSEMRKREQAEAEKRARKARDEDYEDSDEESWEDCSTDDDDNNVDERFDDMVEEEIIDEGEDEEDEDDAYAELQAEAKEVRDAMKKVSFAEGEEDDDEDEEGAQNAVVFRRDKGDQLEEGHELVYSNKAYDSFFQLRTEYPCLSFDVVKDDLGAGRTKYPLTMYFVCGSQADEKNKNELIVLKTSNICRTKHDQESDEESDDDFIGKDEQNSDDDDGEEDGEEVNGGEPVVTYRAIPHFGTANRVRCDHTNRSLVAVWSDAGHVQVFDIEDEYRQMADFSNWSKEQAKASMAATKAGQPPPKKSTALRFCSSSTTHKTEGYAVDWSSVAESHFATGDCNGDIYVWKPAQSRWSPLASAVGGRGATSVEEIKWSPLQSDVFVSCRCGGTVQVWDTRDMRQNKISWSADTTDINVADWNKARQSSHLLATGSDSGNVAIWDLRMVAQGEFNPIQELNFHRGNAITSLEFSAHNESVLAVTSNDGQCTLWDLSLERDADEEKEIVGELFERNDISHLPDQLMFQHQGLQHPKEVHMHSLIPGMTITTDYQGLHLFKPMNWRDLMK